MKNSYQRYQNVKCSIVLKNQKENLKFENNIQQKKLITVSKLKIIMVQYVFPIVIVLLQDEVDTYCNTIYPLDPPLVENDMQFLF